MHRKDLLITGNVYHIFNRGVNKAQIFYSQEDYQRFIDAASHYLISSSKFSYERFNKDLSSRVNESIVTKDSKVEILAYCLMPNHFHFLVKQLLDRGITDYFKRLSNSYSHYVNVKYKRVGPLFQGRFKNVHVETDEQLLHLSRYIHLNPFSAGLVGDLKNYHWSSYLHYSGQSTDGLCNSEKVVGFFKSASEYEKFVLDHADYAKELDKIKHLGVDYD